MGCQGWWTFRIFFIFFLVLGQGKGEASEEAVRGAGLNKKQREGGGFSEEEARRGRVLGNVCGRAGGGG